MKPALRASLALLFVLASPVFADSDEASGDGYSIKSLNTPDPIFVRARDSVQITVTADSAKAAERGSLGCGLADTTITDY